MQGLHCPWTSTTLYDVTRVATVGVAGLGVAVVSVACLSLESECIRYVVTVAVSFVARVAVIIRLTLTVDARQESKNAT